MTKNSGDNFNQESLVNLEIEALFENHTIREVYSQDPTSRGTWWVLGDVLKYLSATQSTTASIVVKRLDEALVSKFKIKTDSGYQQTWCINETGMYKVAFMLETDISLRIQSKIIDYLIKERKRKDLEIVSKEVRLNKRLDLYAVKFREKLHLLEAANEVAVLQEERIFGLELMEDAVFERAHEFVDAANEKALEYKIALDTEFDGDSQNPALIERRNYQLGRELAHLKAEMGLLRDENKELKEILQLSKREIYKNSSSIRNFMMEVVRAGGDVDKFFELMVQTKYMKGNSSNQKTFTKKMRSNLILHRSGEVHIQHKIFEDLLCVIVMSAFDRKGCDFKDYHFDIKKHEDWFMEVYDKLYVGDEKSSVPAVKPTKQEIAKRYFNNRTPEEVKKAFDAQMAEVKRKIEEKLNN